MGRGNDNGKTPKCFLGQIFNFKLGRFAVVNPTHGWPRLESNTHPRFSPVG
jgi:hypothetical protein